MITTHHGYPALKQQAREAQNSIHVVIGETLETLREDAGMETLTELTKDMHFYPDLHGKLGSPFPISLNFFGPIDGVRNLGFPRKCRVHESAAPPIAHKIDIYTDPTRGNHPPVAVSRMRAHLWVWSWTDPALKSHVTLKAIAS